MSKFEVMPACEDVIWGLRNNLYHHQCTRSAVGKFRGRNLCRQHLKSAERRAELWERTRP